METINVNKFIEDYNKTTNETFRGNVIKGIMKDVMLGYAQKLAIAKTVARRVCYTPTENNQPKFEVKTSIMAFQFVIELLHYYTKLEISNDETIAVYDSLDQCGALTDIINAIPEKERSEIDLLTKLCVDDEIQNHGSPLNQIIDTINALYSSIGELANNFTEEEKAKIIELASARIGKGE